MRAKIQGTSEELEVGQFREVKDKGPWKATFSIMEYPSCRKTLDCRYFERDGQRWFSFPSKAVKKPDAEKPDYIPLVSYGNKDYLERFKAAVMTSIDAQHSRQEPSQELFF